MSIIVKLGLVSLAAGVGGLATLNQLQSGSILGGYQMPALTGLVSLVGLASAAPGAGGPVDRTFTVRRVHIDDLVAQVEIVAIPQGPVRVQANGNPDTLKELRVRAVGDEVSIRLDSDEEEAWFPWNLFNMWSRDRKAQDLKIRISAPLGTPYDIEDMNGSIVAGDLDAPLRLEGHALTARFGRVQNAKISVAGSGRISLGAIKETLDVEIAGSGHVDAPSAAAAQVEIAGGGEIVLGPLAGGLSAEVAGSGNVHVASVNGPVDIEIAGSGDVRIDGGRASPFSVSIAGSGDVDFKGHAVDPAIEVAGSGKIRVASYSGNLKQDTMGSGDFQVTNQAQPQPPTPPAPPAHP